MNFYGIVLSIAIILLILILTYVGLIMRNTSNSKIVFPPVEAKCPDYWDFNGNACVIPAVGSVNLGSIYDTTGSLILNDINTYGMTGNSVSSNSYIDFTTPDWSSQGLSGVCQKQKWASIYGIQWDGVSNYNSC